MAQPAIFCGKCNVLTTYSDRKLQIAAPGGTSVAGYWADVWSYQDYYPRSLSRACRGRMQMQDRGWSAGGYRYGFQGQEMDDEVKGSGNSINYRYRMYDVRIGRFLSIDPLAPEYPWNSPYAFSENRVMDAVELEGLEAKKISKELEKTGEFIKNTIKETAEGVYNLVVGLATDPVETLGKVKDGVVQQAEDFGTIYGEFGKNIYAQVSGENYQIDSDKFVDAVERVGNANVQTAMVAPILGVLGSRVSAIKITSADGFLIRGINITTPVNIKVQRFGNMNLGKPDYWGLRVGSSRFANRTFVAIKPLWNDLSQYTTGVVPQGTQLRIGIVGPQGIKYPGGAIQIIVKSKKIINQETKIIQR